MTNRPLVYIAGPYTGPYRDSIAANIDAARQAAVELANNDIDFFCPHTHTAHFEDHAPGVPESFYINLDLRILAFCDAILMLPDWERSAGSRRELEEAWRLGLGIYFYGVDNISAIKPLDKVAATV